MKFFTPFTNCPKNTGTPTGSRCVDDFSYLPDPETGKDLLQKVGETDLYEKTQLARPDDLYTILKDHGVEPNDVECLRVTKEYAETLIDDFSEAPRTLLEAHETIHRAQSSFDQLPLEVKDEFDNNSGLMLKSLLDGSFETRMSKFLPKKPEEVKSDEAK